MPRMIFVLFFCSGATALIYEVLWSKYLSLLFGSTIQAQTIVLSIFMGGLALGNFLFGRRSVVIKQPLLAYGYMELGIGVYAAVFDLLYRAADGLFVFLGTPLLNNQRASTSYIVMPETISMPITPRKATGRLMLYIHRSTRSVEVDAGGSGPSFLATAAWIDASKSIARR